MLTEMLLEVPIDSRRSLCGSEPVSTHGGPSRQSHFGYHTSKMPMSSPPTAMTGRLSNDVDAEKDMVVYHEMVAANSMTDSDARFLADFTDEEKKTVLRKVDYRLVPMLLVLYLISFIDRANIGMCRHR